MVRNYKQKTQREKASKDLYKIAVEAVRSNDSSIEKL